MNKVLTEVLDTMDLLVKKTTRNFNLQQKNNYINVAKVHSNKRQLSIKFLWLSRISEFLKMSN